MQINLISDTVTIPSEGMLKAMMQAKVGDDVFKTDPTVNALEEKMANEFGMEAALFFPSGTMANQTAIKVHTQPAEQVICDKWAHIFNFEGGGAAFNAGVSCSLIDGDRGMFTAAQVAEWVSDRENYHLAITSLVSLENTTNKGGGACWSLEEIIKIKEVCDTNDLKFHLDGARLYNALVAKNEKPAQYGALFNTISICLSKGLGAPVGSVLLGSTQEMKKALRVRKLFGGGMRQSGFLAAAGIYALENNVNRLAQDHEHAKALGKSLERCSKIAKVEIIETNIVIFYTKDFVQDNEFVSSLKDKGILMISMGEGKLRMVTHLNFTKEMLVYVQNILENM